MRILKSEYFNLLCAFSLPAADHSLFMVLLNVFHIFIVKEGFKQSGSEKSNGLLTKEGH